MAIWNMFSDEVLMERQKVRNYGVHKILKFPGMRVSSYKQQAKRELAMRLELQCAIEVALQEKNKLIDRIEELELKLDLQS